MSLKTQKDSGFARRDRFETERCQTLFNKAIDAERGRDIQKMAMARQVADDNRMVSFKV